MREFSVTDEQPQAARIQVPFALRRYAVVDDGEADRVLRPMPPRPFDRNTELDGAIDVRELVSFDVSRGLADPGKQPHIGADGLFQIEARAQSAAVPAHGCRIRRRGGQCREFNRLIEQTHPAPGVVEGNEGTTDLTEEAEALFKLRVDLKFVKSRIEVRAIRNVREI